MAVKTWWRPPGAQHCIGIDLPDGNTALEALYSACASVGITDEATKESVLTSSASARAAVLAALLRQLVKFRPVEAGE